jgi:hypothetical protein
MFFSVFYLLTLGVKVLRKQILLIFNHLKYVVAWLEATNIIRSGLNGGGGVERGLRVGWLDDVRVKL